MSKDLSDLVVVVTGAATGIGFEIANKFLQNNAKVAVLLDINEKRGQEAATKLNNIYGQNKAAFIKCDVTKDLDVVSENIFKTYKTVDVLVNNAGLLNESQIDRTIEINVTSVIKWSMKFCEHMRTDKNGKGGTIINLASICCVRNIQFGPVYQATKYAVSGFTKSLGHDSNYSKIGVRLVALCPGFTDTDFYIEIKPWDDILTEEFTAIDKDQVWQKPEAVGDAAVEVFLKAPSGTQWVIEGGKPIYEA